jgi:RNA polymerase sigma factor (sigma-70 family)
MHRKVEAMDAVADSLATRASLLGRLRDLSDDAGWRMFFETYWRLIYNVARKRGLADDAAQDVVQETVIAVARRMPEFRYDPAKGSFKAWLLLITRRKIMDHFRRFYRSLPAADSRARERIATPEADVAIEAAWEAEWREHIVEAALARVRTQVQPKHFQVFDYCVRQNRKAGEVARMLGLNPAQVYLAKHRTTAAVRRAVAQIEAELAQSGTHDISAA